MSSIPPGTQALLIANCVVYVLQIIGLDPMLVPPFALWSFEGSDFGEPGFWPWQLVTYAFLHGSPTHLFFNMFALYMFGGPVEAVYGRSRFLTYYFVCVVSAGLCQLLITPLLGVYGPTIGASGGVFGLLLAYALLYPHRTLMLIFPPIPMPAWLFVTLYGLLELVLGVTGSERGVAHFAHLGGMLGGYLLIKYGRARRG
ncbi:MAG TPA: rhomboid family intramembrane serine protease [Burkholderiaceae bacterium]|nr:rhomboid family intramembrane serine protease [Burkholderiaceae bacterium]